MKKKELFFLLICIFLMAGNILVCQEPVSREGYNLPANVNNIAGSNGKKYRADWESLSQWESPDWFEDAVFGIYWHWGPYSVAGYGYCCWYGNSMYSPDQGPDYTGSDCYKHHVETWGDPFTEFGYKDFIPMLTAEKWEPEKWAELFDDIGADFAGPCAEHHDGFSMWDSDVTIWNSKKMGPHRDIVGETAEAVKAHGMPFIVTFHNNGCNNWVYFEPGREGCPDGVDVNNPDYFGLYGEPHDSPGAHGRMCLEFYNKTMEVIDKYDPQMIWLEGCMDKKIIDEYMPEIMAYYFNKSDSTGKGVVVTHKNEELPLDCSPLDFEGGGKEEPDRNKWQTDIPLPGCTWAYQSKIQMSDEEIERGADRLVDNIVDRTSKNGVTLLSLGPRADGTIPDYQVKMLTKLGDWMKINKEALHGTTPAPFADGGVDTWKAGNIRFTEKGDWLYAIELKEINKGFVIPGLKLSRGSKIQMLGSFQKIRWHQDGNDIIIDNLPEPIPCDYAWSFKISKKNIVN